MKGKRVKHLLVCLLSVFIMLSLLSACGQSNNANDNEAESETFNAEDFYGCWEFMSVDEWLYIYGDGTYEWFDEDGSSYVGNYYMEDGELCLENSDLRFALDGEGGMECSDGDSLFISELPDFEPVAYFEGKGYDFDFELDAGRYPLEDGARYFYNDGSYYTTGYIEWALTTISDEIVYDQYREITFRASSYFLEEYDPDLGDGSVYGSSSDMFDYYTGERLPMNAIHGESTADENTYSYTLNINGEEVRLDYTKALTTEWNVGDCSLILHTTMTVRMPVDYDGLVFCALPSADTFDENNERILEAEGYVVGQKLEDCLYADDAYNTLFARIY